MADINPTNNNLVIGELIADDLLSHSTGKVSGTLECHELGIQRGGKFKSNMNQK